MATLVILRGLPASGKSTWARKTAATTPNTVVVSLDGLRRMTAGSLAAYHQRRTDRTEQLIVRAAHAMACDALRKGVNVIMDAQNATMERVHALVGLAADCNAAVQTMAFPASLDTLLERNRARAEDDRVPEEYLRAQYERCADTIAVPMQWVRVPVEPAGRHMWRPSEHGHATALVDAMGAYRMACKPLSVEPFRMVKAFLPSQHGRNHTADMLRVPALDNPLMPSDVYCAWLRHGTSPAWLDWRMSNTDDLPCPEPEPTLLDRMRANPNVRVKPVQGETDLYACNFTRDAFRNHAWDEYSSKARGLFLNGRGDVVMRGFDKFFNLGENEQTSLDNVLERMTYPARIETKENGFLGLIGAAEQEDGFRFYSKSGQTDYSPLIEKAFLRDLPDPHTRHEIWQTMRAHDVTVACEIVDTESDQHIIHYAKSRLYYLHAIHNQTEFTIDTQADSLLNTLFPYRPDQYMIQDETDLRQALHDAGLSSREGVVIYSADGYMVKVKSDLYLQSKRLRPMLENILLRGKPVPPDGSERSRLVRAVLAAIPRERLVYHQSAFGRDAVDMTKITDWLRKETLA
ncbi:RNA ligase [Bifidobacterium pseudolongum]|uniref:RNA ligase n=1 Tax=Bifidobacterium pseudolongum subsp. globosum TaxID=1690 RepID=A0A2N3QNC3_9BIFI|nr:RNA ligase [Bifidobacterium pseudolongum]PKU93179.1 RNA ligase [Bifidobacterium pseudolongum subsp. globosum]PKU98848.1 RNA ligase [Bifidobacterium pseudolongum subsp. globosum]